MVGMSEGRDNDISVKQARRCRAAAEVWPRDQATAVKSKFPGEATLDQLAALSSNVSRLIRMINDA